jgi:hypothetical protein
LAPSAIIADEAQTRQQLGQGATQQRASVQNRRPEASARNAAAVTVLVVAGAEIDDENRLSALGDNRAETNRLVGRAAMAGVMGSETRERKHSVLAAVVDVLHIN